MLQAVVLVAIALALVFFGLTRTQVGRDELRSQITAAFNGQFEGSLEVGELTGNLVYDLYATDVRLRDPQGRVVIVADSVVLKPTWLSLVRRRLEIDEAVLFRPRVELVRSDSGRWNIADVFASRLPRSEPGRPLALAAPDLRIIDGTFVTRNEGDAPTAVQRGTLFDYTEATLADLNVEANLTWEQARRRIDIDRFSGRLPAQDLQISSLAGNLDLTGGRVQLDDFALTTASSEISGDFARLPSSQASAFYQLDLAASRVSGDELRRIVPALPLADAVDLSAELAGSLDALTVDALRLARGASEVQAEGQLVGWPDDPKFTVSVPRATLRAEDLEAVVPELDVPMLRRLGTAKLRLDAGGAFGSGRFQTDARFSATTAVGRADGTGRVALRRGQPPTYGIEADIEGVDPGLVLDDPQWAGDLTGRIELDGRGIRAETLAGNLVLALTNSTFAGRTFDALDADVRVEEALRFDGTVALVAGGRLQVEGTAALADTPSLDLRVDAADFDLRRLLPSAPATDLTVDATLTGSGASLDEFDGMLTVAFEPSTMALGGEARPIAAHRATLRAQPGRADQRLTLDSDLLGVRVGGDVNTGAFATLVTQWADAFARTVSIEADKYLYAATDTTPSSAPIRPVAAAAPQDVTLDVEIRDPAALQAFLPGFPGFAPGTGLDARARIAPDSLVVEALVSGDSLRVPGVFGTDVAGTLAFRSGYGRTLVGRTALDVDLAAGTLRLPIGPLADATTRLRLRDRQADLAVKSDRLGEAGRFGLDASLALLPDRNRFTLHTFEAVIGKQTWALDGNEPIDLYSDAIVIPGLAFERIEETTSPPRLALSGTLSGLDSDSLHVDAEALDLNEVFTVIGLRDLFGGRFDAEFAVASVLRQPVVVGAGHIEQFTFAGRRAGRIDLDSRYVPGTDAVAVNLHLMPDGDPASVVNDLRAAGTVRFPGTADDGTRDRGALDLALTIDRLDLFIFDWLFPSIVDDAGGFATGTGQITGVPRVPLFDANLRIREGRFRVPDFGLALEAEGRVTVDREGFHIRNAQLSDKSGGQGLVRGDILFNDYRFFSFDLAADLAEMEIIDVPESRDLPFYGNIRATGSATLTGPIDNVFLRATDAQTTPDSEMFIPVTASGPAGDAGFLVFADSLGNVPEFEERRSLIAKRPEDERAFLDGLEMNLGINAPPGSTVHLVFDPSIGDVITAVGSAQLQLSIREGEFLTFGTFDVARGDYLFTAGDVFTRQFALERGGTLQWDGDPIDARIDLPATYRTRASLAGLNLPGVDPRQRVPIVISLDVSGRVLSPLVDLSIALDETNRTAAGGEALRRQLNQPDRQAEYATSVLLTNSFLLAPSENPETIRDAADELFFTSLSQLVSSRLNLFLNDALGSENVDVLFGVQQGATAEDFDLTYGVALRLLDERLVIRGEGIYQRQSDRPVSEELQGEVAVEVRLGPSVALEVFYRREGDVLLGSALSATPYGAYGAGVNYETAFPSWHALLRRIIGDAEDEREEAASAAPF